MTTDRLVLRPVTQALKQAMADSRQSFARAVRARLPDGWPEFPQAFRPAGPQHPAPWTGYLFLSSDQGQVIGNGGFVAPPDPDGAVEIGYEIAPRFRNQGFATEAARMLVRIARAAGANGVIAHSLAEPNASNAIMWNIGMTFVGEKQRGPLTVWRWGLDLRAAPRDGIPWPANPPDPADSRGNAA